MDSYKFWSKIFKTYWGRKPGVFKGARPPFALTEDELFNLLCDMANRFRATNDSANIRFFIGDLSCTYAMSLKKFLPKQSDGSLTGFASRMKKELRGKPWGLIVNGLHNYSRGMVGGSLEFLKGYIEARGYPFGSVNPDVFVGTYKKTPFGLHKDDQHVFTYVVHGKKTFVTYPFECFKKFPTVSKDDIDGERNLFIRDNIPYVKGKIVLTGNSGDLMYWPNSYWHMANSNGLLVATLGFGIRDRVSGAVIQGIVDRTVTTFHKKIGQTKESRFGPTTFKKTLKEFKKYIGNHSIETSIDAVWHTRLRSLHFQPPLSHYKPLQLSRESTIILRNAFPLCTKRIGNQLLVMCFGNYFLAAYSDGLIRVIRTLNKKKKISVHRIVESFFGRDPWNTKDFGVALDGILPFLSVLDKHGYIERVEVS